MTIRKMTTPKKKKAKAVEEIVHPRAPLLQYKIAEGRWVSEEEAWQLINAGTVNTPNNSINDLHSRHSAFCQCPNCAGRAPAFRI